MKAQMMESGRRRNQKHAASATNGVIRMLAHDMRTPLSVIHQYTAILRGGILGDLTGEQDDSLETIATRAEALNDLLNDLVDFEALDAGALTMHRRQISIVEVLASDFDLIRAELSEKNYALQVDVAADLPPVFCDAGSIRRALRTFLLAMSRLAAPESTLSLKIFPNANNGTVQFEISCTPLHMNANKIAAIDSALSLTAPYPAALGESLGLSAFIARRFLHINLTSAELVAEGDQRLSLRIIMPMFEMQKVLQTYRDYAPAFYQDIAYVGLSQICYEAGNENDDEFFEDVLHSSIRNTDLLIQKEAGVWLLVQPRDQASCILMTDRLRERMHALSPGLTPSDMPFRVDQLGFWRWSDEYAAFCEAFAERYFSLQEPGASERSNLSAPQVGDISTQEKTELLYETEIDLHRRG